MTDYIEKYLFLRTRLAVDLSDDALLPLSRVLSPEDSYLLFSAPGEEDEGFTWENGIVLRISDKGTCADTAEELSEELAAFDAWAIHDCDADWIESPAGGPLSSYFAAARGPSAMLFLLEPDNFRTPDDLASQVRDRLPGSAPVFYFRGGRILMTRAPDPYRIIANRIGTLADRYEGFAGCDRDGTSFERRQENPRIWHPIGFSDLRFG